ncbi:DNA methyltransferase [Micromonospora sp. M12]
MHAKKTYALLQTPRFVERFILDRTFEPAVREFGLAATSVIDPTCGSGHFLLGAFHRLVGKWQHREPATDIKILAERALGQVTGVDINPFAVAIARFRLLIAAMKVCGLTKLERTPAFPVRVATGDSLLPWARSAPGRRATSSPRRKGGRSSRTRARTPTCSRTTWPRISTRWLSVTRPTSPSPTAPATSSTDGCTTPVRASTH